MSITKAAMLERLGLRFIVEPQSVWLSSREKELLAELKPLGVMFRRRNFLQDVSYSEWLESYRQLLHDVRAAIGRDAIVTCVDHEGGQVHRFPAPITQFPYAMTYGESLSMVREVSRAMAIELASLGINLTFSPVADVHSNPQNPVIHRRAFSTSPEVVAKAALCSVREYRAQRIIPCAKHFPGHGDTSVDSHVALPVVSRTREALEQCELIPFRALIQEGIEMIMTGHLVVPEIDPDNQATISPRILGDLLRRQLHYSGVTISDALGMQAILPDMRSGDFAVRAHRAGLNIFLMAGDVVSIEDAIVLRNELYESIECGEMPRVDEDASIAFIQKLLARLAMHEVEMLPARVLEKHKALKDTLEKKSAGATFDFSPEGFE